MQEYKTSIETFTKLGPFARLGKFKWWFIILLILGLLALWYLFFHNVPQTLKKQSITSIGLVQPQTKLILASFQQNLQLQSASLQPYIVPGIFALLAIVFIISLLVTLFSTNPEKVKSAGDIVKTCLGFFIGAATSALGNQ